MAGIYIHIPFCKQACHYCDFHFSTSLKTYEGVVKGIRTEIAQRSVDLKGELVDTIYFGGGTPSLLKDRDLKIIMEDLRSSFSIASTPEITLEANPDDLAEAHFLSWKNAGINRLSIGIQSFHNEDLQWMNRAHNAQEALTAVKKAQDHGFLNLTIDLIYGIPNSTHERWKENVETALSLQVPHISAYALTVEDRTALAHFIREGKVVAPQEDRAEEDFQYLRKALLATGYHHYEISNFSLPGMNSKHNSAYWSGVSYLGLGPGAHGFGNGKRRWNISNNALYARMVEKGEVFWEEEILSDMDQFNEWVMTGLRRLEEGVDLERVGARFGEKVLDQLLEDASPYLEAGDLQIENGRLRLTEKSIFRADGIASDLFQLP
ncbi:MAG: radical SAM family heme chaperone HemW [Bacteroidota bacterium]|nr:radical SAM family heme chaperone HemW [Bacteroidota bacterium]MDX5427628.1 radical SAM family heme chaperone HemW [Bacteroidota bacterium]MDX5505536.1 radical SAM family heme chaperone HemW [Bacteroidota bacterium]